MWCALHNFLIHPFDSGRPILLNESSEVDDTVVKTFSPCAFCSQSKRQQQQRRYYRPQERRSNNTNKRENGEQIDDDRRRQYIIMAVTASIFAGCTDSCGYAAAAMAAISYGSYGVPIKHTLQIDVHPLVFQTYKTLTMFVTCPFVLAMGVVPDFTAWGLLSGFLWVVGGAAGVFAIRNAGMAVAVGTWASVRWLVRVCRRRLLLPFLGIVTKQDESPFEEGKTVVIQDLTFQRFFLPFHFSHSSGAIQIPFLENDK